MKKTAEPFKVTCKLLDGRINSADGIINLDAILYHAWFLKNEPDVINGTAAPKKERYYMGLPLTRTEDNRYLASLGFYKQYSQSVEYWNKRPDFTHANNSKYLDAAGKIDTSAGQMKAYHFPQIIRTVSDIEFYGVGTIKKIKELLQYIPAVGKKPATGWGQVREWVVEPFGEDWGTFSSKYGLMRPMPVGEFKPDRNYMVMDCQLSPPYWKNYNTALCYIPNFIINGNFQKEPEVIKT